MPTKINFRISFIFKNRLVVFIVVGFVYKTNDYTNGLIKSVFSGKTFIIEH
jgi:hypothetical protein